MTTRRLIACAVVLVALAVGVTVDANAASRVVHAPPDAPCNSAHVMDLVITEDGVWFECVCEKLIVGIVCDWYELGPAPDAATIRRRSWRFVSRGTQKQLLVLHRWPRFVDPPRRITAPAPTKIVAGVAAPVLSAPSKCADPFLADDAWAASHGC